MIKIFIIVMKTTIYMTFSELMILLTVEAFISKYKARYINLKARILTEIQINHIFLY